MEEEILQPKLKPVRVMRFSSHPRGLVGPGEVELFWHVENAQSIHISPSPGLVEEPHGSIRIKVAATTLFTLTAQAGSAESKFSITVKVIPLSKNRSIKSNVLESKTSTQRGDGSLTIAPITPPRSVGPGRCPTCSRIADEWQPPRNNAAYNERIATLREVFDIDATTAERKFLIDTGGYIHACAGCGTTFFVSIKG